MTSPTTKIPNSMLPAAAMEVAAITKLSEFYSKQHEQQQKQQQQHLRREGANNYNKSHSYSCSSLCSRRLFAVSVAILICLLSSGITKTNAVPTDSIATSANGEKVVTLLQRALRDVTSMTANLMQQKEQQQTAATQQQTKEAATSTDTQQQQVELQPQPQGQCLLDGMWVPENTVYCEKQTGCRAIQKTGHCCPDYKCDCEKDGKIYANGDKLVDPDTPCTVCYCKGGEILCSSVTCFHRDDCKPKYIAGRCCPEYDNCPIVSKTTAITITSTAKPDTSTPQQPTFNWNITIKEITKPTEIRITDDTKPKPMMPMIPTRKPSTTEAPTPTAAPTPATDSIVDDSATPTPTTAVENSSDVLPILMTESSNLIGSFMSTERNHNLSVDNNPSKSSLKNGIESLKLSASVAYALPNNKSMATASPTSIENSGEEVSHTTVLAVKPISAFGLENLPDENDPSKVNIKREYMVTTEGVTSSESKLSQAAIFIPNGFGDTLLDSSVEAEPELDTDTAGSDNIYHIIATTEGPGTTDRVLSPTKETQDNMEILNTQNGDKKHDKEELKKSGVRGPKTTQRPRDETKSSTDSFIDNESVFSYSTVATLTASSTEITHSTSTTTEHLDEELEAAPIEANPAYPSLPEDDFSLRDVNFPLVESDDIGEPELKDEPRSITAYEHMPTKHEKLTTDSLDGSGAGSGSGGGMGHDAVILPDMSATAFSEHMVVAASSSSSLAKHVPIMYSVEENSAETTIQNATDFQLGNLTQPQSPPDTSGELSLENESLETILEDAASGSGSGNGEVQPAGSSSTSAPKPREHTTARPTPHAALTIDIDEVSGDGQTALAEDPKLDAESLKLNESQEENDSVAKTPNAAADKAGVRAEKSVEAPEAVGQRWQRLYLQRVL